MLNRLLTRFTHRIHDLPILILMPHSRCNCRCVMCDIWKANTEKRELTAEDLRPHLASLKKLRVRWVVLSGGEALMHTNLWALCVMLRQLKIRITLLTTGLLLKKFAREVAESLDEVIVSLDGSRAVHNKIRNVPQAFEKMEEGIQAVRNLNPAFRITARCVLQRQNFHDLDGIIAAAKELQLDQLSFLTADVSTSAFNRAQPWAEERVDEVSLDKQETQAFEQTVETSIARHAHDFATRFIAESPTKMRKMVQYYKAINGLADFPEVRCNAPWVSAVLESDKSVAPCFFLPAYGSIGHQSFEDVVNAPRAIQMRRELRVSDNPTCQKCVCSLNLGLTTRL